MAKILLRSGSLDDYQAVGENGQSVFDSALQIRETLRLRKQQALIDCLAIPQINDDGDRVDWYAPFPGSVRGWAAADSDTRERALKSLEKTIAGALALSKRCMQSDKAPQVRFGALLAKALQFPGSNHVYLVDDRAVITFWGFVNLNESVADDVLACLAIEAPPEPEIDTTPEEELVPEPVTVTLSEPDAPLLTPPPAPAPVAQPAALASTAEPLVYTPYPVNPVTAAPQSAVQTPQPEPQPAPAARKKQVPLWALPVAAVVVAAVAVPAVWIAMKPAAPAVAVAAPAPVQPVAIAPAPVQAVPALTASLPLREAQFTPPPAPEPPPAPVVIEPPPKDALVMDAEQVRIGSTTFLNGNWRVEVDFRDPVSGKVPALRYQINKNKGQTTVTLRGKVTCKAEVFSGLHSDGTLMIKTRGAARCSDGARYNVPEIACKATENNAAQCTGQYDEKTVVPVIFRKVSA